MIHWFSNCVEEAFRQTKELLWPIRFNVWLILFFLNLLTGGLGGAPGLQFSIPNFGNLTSSKTASSASSTTVAPSPPSLPALQKEIENKLIPLKNTAREFLKENKKIILTLALLLFLMGLLWIMAWMWLHARLKMVLIKSLLTKTFALRTFWKETRAQGESFFLFNFVAWIVFILPVFFVPIYFLWAYYRHTIVFREHIVILVLIALGLAMYLIVYALVLSAINRFLPIYMMISGRGIRDAFRHLFGLSKNALVRGLGTVLLYALVSIGVGILIGIVLGIVGIGLLVLFGVGALITAFLIKLHIVLKILIVIVGVLLVTPIMILIGIVAFVPAETFKNYLGIELISKSDYSA